jgi:hypothetical protein
MNSLSELNSYSNTGLTYADDRSFEITFDHSPTTQTVLESEGIAHRHPVAANIVSSRGVANNAITYTIDVSSVSGASVIWPTPLPAGVTATVPTTGVYRLSNISSPLVWNSISSPMIQPPASRTADWTYTANIAYPTYANASSKTWTTNVTVTELTQPTAAYYDEDTVFTIGATPTFANIASNSGLTYTANVVPYPVRFAADNDAPITNLSSTGIGGTSTFYNSPVTLKITGTKAQVASHLANIVATPHPDNVSTFSIDYNLISPVHANTSVRQTVINRNVNLEAINLGINRYYTQNHTGLLFGSNPIQIYETVAGTPSYTINLTIVDPAFAGRGIIGLGESYTNPVGWDGATYTFTGSKSECNTVLQNLQFQPFKDVNGTYTLIYTQYRDTYLQVSDTVQLIGQSFTGNLAGQGTFVFSTTGSTTFTPTYTQAHYLKYDILAIAGGGSGGATNDSYVNGGGGGAGGLVYQINSTALNETTLTGTDFTISVGAGGFPSSSDGANGSNTYIASPYTTTIQAVGGGGGGGYLGSGSRNGRSGGSGGGASGNRYSSGTNLITGGTATSGQGHAGGNSNLNYLGTNAGGGGGAGTAGAPNKVAGAGSYNTITGANVQYAAGGYSGVTTNGSGGAGATSAGQGQAGQQGLVVIKFYQ